MTTPDPAMNSGSPACHAVRCATGRDFDGFANWSIVHSFTRPVTVTADSNPSTFLRETETGKDKVP